MLLGKERATVGKFNTSPIMSIITRPRYASTAMLRGGADGAFRMAAGGRSASALSAAIVECIPIALIHSRLPQFRGGGFAFSRDARKQL
jgi:hypothetical protein